MANVITTLRIILSFALLFFSPLSVPFYVLYITAGITDMLDGTIARKTNTVSRTGAALDTIADFVFVLVCLIKLLPVLDIEKWMLVCIGIIAMIKVINIVSGFVVQKRFVTVHSVMNRITGILLFALPLSFGIIGLRVSVSVVCAVAAFAAVQEGHFIRTGKGE
ncbi:MAG: CDP-alcohol phosphatidyltransferase family protein [Lachnospiraceae bacterium]|jgi:phosphatidylglycerophosphate synthase